MKKLSSLIAAALLLAACGSNEDPAQQYRDALPKSAAVQVGTYQAEGTTAGALTVASDALGGSVTHSQYAIMSYYLALSVNGGVVWTLRVVQYITAFPPTSCDDSSCTWGPFVGDDGLNRWELTVTKSDGAFDWTLAGQNGADATSAWVSLITGTAHPVDRDHGSGTFTVDFDAQTALRHGDLWVQRDFGQLVVDYDNTHDVAVDASFQGAKTSPDDPDRPSDWMNADYSFRHASSGGTLQIAFHDLDTTEFISLHTRWTPVGAGRADVVYDPDDAGAASSVTASQCWAGSSSDYAEVYDSGDSSVGVESACSPFSTPEYVYP